MRIKLLLSFLLLFSAGAAPARQPSWVKSGYSSGYPQERFLTAVGKGNTEKDALADAQRNITENIFETLVSNGMEKVKIDIAPASLTKPFEKGYSYYDNADNIWYVFGVVDKNMLRINIEDDLYAAEQLLQSRTSIYDGSELPVISKIKAAGELLELYARRDLINALKESLWTSAVKAETGDFERERLETERKRLFENVAFYVKTENFNASALRKFLEDGGFAVVPELPADPPAAGKGIAVINCNIQISAAPGRAQNKSGWIADLVLNDAFNGNAVLYSKTVAGDESGADEKEALSKASAAAEAAINAMAEDFFKSVE